VSNREEWIIATNFQTTTTITSKLITKEEKEK